LWAKVNPTDAARTLIDDTILKPAVSAIDKRFTNQPVVDAQLRQVLADCYERLTLYDASLPLQVRALETRRSVLGEEDPDTLSSINYMGGLLSSMGRWSEAEAHFRDALQKRRRRLGDEHEDTLTSISNLGSVLQAQGKYAEAEVYLREAMEELPRVRGKNHRDTLSAINNMGGLLHMQYKLSEAELYYREALEKRRREFGDEDPDTIESINNLGILLREQGKLSEAVPYHIETLEKMRRVKGEEHDRTIGAIASMGGLLRDLGKHAEAEPYFREAVEKSRPKLGEEHPSTLIYITNWGDVLRAQGRNNESISLLMPVEAAARKVFVGGNARRLALFLTTLGRARTGLEYSSERFVAAEANLLEAHTILAGAQSVTTKDSLPCLLGLVDLYVAWDTTEPGKGHDAKAAEWNAKLESAQGKGGTEVGPSKSGGLP
jgi:tetratricopeptide (TPR) repeat protein